MYKPRTRHDMLDRLDNASYTASAAGSTVPRRERDADLTGLGTPAPGGAFGAWYRCVPAAALGSVLCMSMHGFFRSHVNTEWEE